MRNKVFTIINKLHNLELVVLHMYVSYVCMAISYMQQHTVYSIKDSGTYIIQLVGKPLMHVTLGM